jgi:thiamine-monophosphate kinase
MPSDTVKDIGEFGLIGRIAAALRHPRDRRIILDIGHDAAIVRAGRSFLAVTTDTVVEGTHFDLRFDRPFDIGYRAFAGAVSDLVPVNADPLCAVVSLALAPTTEQSVILAMMRGMHTAARTLDCPLVGGDTVRTQDGIVATVTIVGTRKKPNSPSRAGARPGDVIFVSGDLGGAVAALRLLQDAKRPFTLRSPLLRKRTRPQPRFDVMRAMRSRKITMTSAIDISDGLISELHHLAEMSMRMMVIDPSLVPCSASTARVARRFNSEPLAWALASGEEYQLLFTVQRADAPRVARIPDIRAIGYVARGTGVAAATTGRVVPLSPSGFTHF